MARNVKRAKRAKPPSVNDSSSDEIEEFSEEVIELARKPVLPASTSWLEKYQPRDCSSVCINPRKAKEVREILGQMVNGSSKCRLLVLSGPSGSSKSTLARCLANDLVHKPGSESVVEYIDSALAGVGQRHFFEQFMDECRYLVGKNKSVVLIEDLPNVFHKETLDSFRGCLREWIFSPDGLELPPVILCLSEVEINGDENQRSYTIDKNLTVETLLGRDLLSTASAMGLLTRVKFSPIARTFMKKTLTTIMSRERLNPRDSGFENFLESSYESGDIRSSICNLEFWAGTKSLELLESFHRNNQITIFHAIGKVIHSSGKLNEKFTEADKVDYESIQAVLDSYQDHHLLSLGLLENYSIFNGSQFDVSIAANIVDSLSINDTLNGLEEGEDFAFRSTRNELRQVEVKPGRTMPMKFPRHFKCLMESNKVRKEVNMYTKYITDATLSFSNANLYDGYLVPQIKNAFRYRLKNGQKRFRYNRLGGALKEIYADESLTVMEEDDEAESVKDQLSEDIKDAVIKQNAILAEEDELSDEIESSSEELEDDLDDELLSFATQTQAQAQTHSRATENGDEKNETVENTTSDDDFSDDGLDMLVSSGRL